MVKLSCVDIDPNSVCNFEATGKNASEVAEKMMAHARTDHPDDVEALTDSEIIEMLEPKVHA